MSTRNKKYSAINYDEPIDITIGKKVYKNVNINNTNTSITVKKKNDNIEKKEKVKNIFKKIDINTESITDTITDIQSDIDIDNESNINNKALVKKRTDNELIQSLDDLGCKFNMVVFNIFRHIENYYNEYYTELSYLKTLMEQMTKQNENCLIELFIKNIYANDDYRTNILNQNEDYFLKSSFNVNKSDILANLRKLWGEMDLDSKKFIKKSLLCLVKLSNKYILI
jgi:hypothetical protein